MPLFRVQTQTKKKEPRRPKRDPRSKDDSEGSGRFGAVAVGAAFGLIAVAAISAGMLWASRSQSGESSEGISAEPPQSIEGVSDQVPLVPAPPMTSDFASDAVIAYVSGQTYQMADLEMTVRIARVLGAFTGDEVPADGSPDLRAFMVMMLRRQIDIMLMRQAMAREGILEPGGDNQILIDAFLGQVGGTRADLEQLMVLNSVTDDDLANWFSDARAINFYIQNTLLAGQDAAERDAIVQQWLAQAWETQEIQVEFYDPDAVLPVAPEQPPSDEDESTGTGAP